MKYKRNGVDSDPLREVNATTIVTENLNRKRSEPGHWRFGLIGSIVIVLLILWAFWSWGFCRFYVGPGRMAVITAKSGADLPPGQALAKPGQKGVLEDVLGEGRHIWNPLFYDWEIVPAQFIPPGKVGIVTSLVGEQLPLGEFMAEPGQKGIWRKVLGPGMYRFNPYGYSITIIDAVAIPLGFAGVVTNKSGFDAKEGVFAAADQKGIRSDVLQPGLYYINPYQYEVEALEVGLNQVSLLGQGGSIIQAKNVIADENNQMIQRLNQNVLDEQKRRRSEEPRRQSVAEESVRDFFEDSGRPARELAKRATMPVSQAPRPTQGVRLDMEMGVPPEYILNQYVTFPSRDAFNITLGMTLEFELQPKELARIRMMTGDLPKVVRKIIMPITSWAQNKGAEYRAVDFIAGEGKERFQNDLTSSLKQILGNDNIIFHSALVSNVMVPDQILEPLRVTSLSKETELTNKEKQNTAKKQADLNREMSLIRQSGEQVAQETTKMKAQIQAEMERTVATIQAETQRKVAAIDKETAEVRASKTVALGKADAESIQMVEEEKARGFGMKIQAFGRDGGDYALYEFANQLNPDLRIKLIHAGEGTLWTDLKSPTFSDIGAANSLKKK